MGPEITVIMPVYNGEAYLSESVNTVLTQSYENFELLIIDNGSTDNSIEIVQRFLKEDKRIRLLENHSGKGMVENWNYGLRNSLTNWVKFQFQDDLMLPTALEEMLSLAQTEQCDLVLTDREYFWSEDISEKETIFYRELSRLSTYFPKTGVITSEEIADFFSNGLLEINFLGEPIVGLIHKDLLHKYGYFDEACSQLVDFEYWLRLATNERTGFINKQLQRFRVHSFSESKRNEEAGALNPSTRDIVLIGLKILKHTDYEFLRKHFKSKGISFEKYLRRIIKKIIKTHGKEFVQKEFGDEAIKISQFSIWK